MASKDLDKAKSHVWFTYSEHRYGGEAINPEDRWTDHTDEHIEFSLTHCYDRSEKIKEWIREQVDVSFEPKVEQEVYVVVVRYTTGGTFGRTLGAWYIEGVYEHQGQADKVVKAIEKDKYQGYKPWIGYFEHLESVDYERMTVM